MNFDEKSLMSNCEITNDYLLELLALQQDGRQAISAPSNWTTQSPLLDVQTDVDKIVDDLSDAILERNGENRTARWHFFIGSPGNGKSAAMGKLCQRLLNGNVCRVLDESGVAINDLDNSAIPYAIYVYERDNKYASTLIIQDASVVRNPYSPDVDPAEDLLRTLAETWEKGNSLIVCTNRGVLEKAYRDKHTDQNINTKPWFKILREIVLEKNSLHGKLSSQRDFDNKKTVFKNVAITYSHLDNRSLLLGRNTIFNQLLEKATNQDNWYSCQSCSSNHLCPFKANRDWLVDSELRKGVIRLLKRGEIFSGQIIVFREALALISFILAGCPRDYNDIHPCQWVKSRVATNDVFSLAVRRIYMCLFGSFCPYGLEPSDSLKEEQLDALKELASEFVEEETEVKEAVAHVVYGPHPTTDIGVTRILGSNGVLASIDPIKETLPVKFYEYWDSDFETFQSNNVNSFGAVEKKCALVWKKLEDKIEFIAKHRAPEAHWAIRRWSSNFFLHLGALVEGYSAWADELDQYAQLLEILKSTRDSLLTIDEKKQKRNLDKRLEEILDAASDEEAAGTVQLTDTVTLAGEWVSSRLKPESVVNEESGSMSLAIKFPDGERAVLGAPMFLWLTRHCEGKLDRRCFPLELLVGATDARVRAASKGKYAFENNDVELIIKTNSDSREVFKITRFDGEVDVGNE